MKIASVIVAACMFGQAQVYAQSVMMKGEPLTMANTHSMADSKLLKGKAMHMEHHHDAAEATPNVPDDRNPYESKAHAEHDREAHDDAVHADLSLDEDVQKLLDDEKQALLSMELAMMMAEAELAKEKAAIGSASGSSHDDPTQHYVVAAAETIIETPEGETIVSEPIEDMVGAPEDDMIGEAEDDMIGEAEDDMIGEAEEDIVGEAEGDKPQAQKALKPDYKASDESKPTEALAVAYSSEKSDDSSSEGSSLAIPMAILGCVAAVVGVAVFTAWKRKKQREAVDKEVVDYSGNIETPV